MTPADEKLEKYQLLQDEIAKVWRMRKVIVMPVVIGALGAVSASRREREVGSYPENSIKLLLLFFFFFLFLLLLLLLLLLLFC